MKPYSDEDEKMLKNAEEQLKEGFKAGLAAWTGRQARIASHFVTALRVAHGLGFALLLGWLTWLVGWHRWWEVGALLGGFVASEVLHVLGRVTKEAKVFAVMKIKAHAVVCGCPACADFLRGLKAIEKK